MERFGIVKLAVVIALAACGGGNKQDATTPPEPTTPPETTPPPDESANMIPPDKMDEVSHDLQRKEMIISRCLAEAEDRGEAPHGTHAHVRFEIKIGPDGHATAITVDKTDTDLKDVIECAKKHVADIAFPTLPHSYETSYEYAMEAN